MCLKLVSHCPIIWWFDDWLDNQMENQSAVGAQNQRMVCDFEESEGISWSLTCQTQSDGLHVIFLFLSLCKMRHGINIRKIVCNRLGGGNKMSLGIRLRSPTTMASNSWKLGNGVLAYQILCFVLSCNL